MLLKDIPYFVKFTFSCEAEDIAITSTDSEVLQFFVDPTTDEPLTGFEIGQTIKIIEDIRTGKAKNYIIRNISIQQLYDDIEMHKYGIDTSDAVAHTGGYKEWLFKVYIEMDTVK